MRALVTAAFVAAIALACIPVVPYNATFTPDETEYMLIGHSWASGSGFVDPVQWHYALEPAPVVPAWAVRPPVLSALLGLGYLAGATTPFLIEVHVIWAALVAGLITLVGSRFMRLPAAAGAGLLIGASPAYVLLASQLLTEVTAIAVFLLVLATVERVARSPAMAALCALTCIVAWATRPNYLGLPLAVVVAVVWQLGPTASLRSRGLWTFVGALGALFLVAGWIATALGGYALYEAQGRFSTQIDINEAMKLVVERPETFEFLRENRAQILEILASRVVDTTRLLFDDVRYAFVGWIAAPGVVWCLVGRPGSVTRRFCALATLGLWLTIVITLAAFDATRYPLLPAVPGALCGFALLSDLAEWAANRVEQARLRPLIAALPLLVAALFVVSYAKPSLAGWTDRWPASESRTPLEPASKRARHVLRLCAQVPADALLATREPWLVARLCGNPVLRIPHRVFVGGTPRQFIEERAPRYLLVSGAGNPLWLRQSDLVSPIAESGPMALLETVAPASEKNTWSGPRPLRCAGHPTEACGRWVPGEE